MRLIKIFLCLSIFFSACANNNNDERDDNSDNYDSESSDFENESCCGDTDYEPWDGIVDWGAVDHILNMMKYKDGYLLSGTIVAEYSSESDLGFVAYIGRDYSVKWKTIFEGVYIHGMDVSDSGMIYISGEGMNIYGMFLASVDEKGAVVWEKMWSDNTFFTSGPQSVDTLKVSGEALLLGGFSGGWNEDGSMTYHKLYLAKADIEGNIIWKKVWGAEGHNYIFDITEDNSEHVYITGNTMGNLDGNTNSNKKGDCNIESAGCSDPFLIKTDSDGNVLWTKQWGSGYLTSNEAGMNVVYDKTDKSVFVLSNVSLFGGLRIVLRKYYENGELIWEKIYEDENRNFRQIVNKGMLVDKQGNVIIAGIFFDIDNYYTMNSKSDIIVLAYDQKNGDLIEKLIVPCSGEVDCHDLEETEKGFLIMGNSIKYSDDMQITYTDAFFKQIDYFYLGTTFDTTKTSGSEIKRETIQSSSTKDDEIVFSYTDSEGNLYVSGNTWGNIEGIKSKGEKDVFVAKYKADRTLEWVKNYGSDKWDDLTTAQIDSDENLILSGTTWGDFEGNQKLGVGDIFVMKIDKTGKKLWASTAGSDNDDWVNGLWADRNGNIYLTGGTLGSIDQEKESTISNSDIFIAKFDGSGKKVLIKQFGERIEGMGINGDNKNGVYVIGKTNFNYSGLNVFGLKDNIVIKLNTDLEEQWARIWGSEDIDSSTGIAIDSAGDVFVTGYTFGPIDGNIQLGANCPGGYCPDAYLTKWDSTGKKKWTKQFGTENGDRASSIVIDEKDNIYISGTAGQNRLCEIESDIFLMKSDTSGNLDEIKIWGTAGEESVNSINISNGKIMISGFTTGGLDNNENKGGKDGFVTVIEK